MIAITRPEINTDIIIVGIFINFLLYLFGFFLNNIKSINAMIIPAKTVPIIFPEPINQAPI